MNFDQFKNKFIELQTEIEPIVSSALKQLLQRELQLQKTNSEVENLHQAVAQAEYPKVALSFITGSGENSLNHLLLFEPQSVLQYYAWMISDEPAESVGEEHFDGLREGFEQVFGQIKMSVADDQASFVLDNVLVQEVDNGDVLAGVLDTLPAMSAQYQLSADGQELSFIYFCWLPVQEEAANGGAGQAAAEEAVTVQRAQFGDLGGNGYDEESSRNVDMLLDVDLEVTVELDRKIVTVGELLKLGKGSIVELEKSAGEPLDIFVNGRKFAEGEVVVIDDKFGIRITQLLSPKDRLKNLG